MAGAHDAGLRRLAAEKAGELGLEMGEGVYVGLAGPSYETPAEVEMLARLGGDLVGMSTVLEVIAAHHLGVRCLCFSLVTNLGAGVEEDETLTHDDVISAGRAARDDIQRLLTALLNDRRLLERG